MDEKEFNQDFMDELIDEPETSYEESPKWKRNLAWGLFGVFTVGVVLWLLAIANPTWVDSVRNWIIK